MTLQQLRLPSTKTPLASANVSLDSIKTMDLWTLLRDIIVLLAACLLMGGLLSRFKQSPLIGYLLAGMFLGGPGSMQFVGSEHEIEAIAELGVALLLFGLGLEFSINRLRQLGPRPLIGGALQVVLTLGLGALCAGLFDLPIVESIAFGAMISLSSTAVVLRMLMERSELEMPHGRNSLAVLLAQDIAVVPLALLMTVLGGEGALPEIAWNVGKLLLLASALILGMMLLNKLAVLALGTLTLHRNRELTVLFAVVSGLGAAWAAHAVGISPALGAFVAGMLLGSSAFSTQIRADISSLRVLLLTLFFGAAGMVADPVWILHNWYLVASVALLLTLGKALIIWGIFRLLGQSTRVAAATGLCLAQIGEFAFVLGSVGKASGIVSTEMYALIVSVTIVSFFLSAGLVPIAPKFGNWIAALLGDKSRPAESNEQGVARDVVIIGFGPTGRAAAAAFLDTGRDVLVLDLNHEGIRKARELGFNAEVGDATQSDVLEHAHIEQANVVVITLPHHASAMTILEHVRSQAPLAYLVVRSRYQLNTDSLVSAGADSVIGDEEEVGESIAEHLRQWQSSTAASVPAEK